MPKGTFPAAAAVAAGEKRQGSCSSRATTAAAAAADAVSLLTLGEVAQGCDSVKELPAFTQLHDQVDVALVLVRTIDLHHVWMITKVMQNLCSSMAAPCYKAACQRLPVDHNNNTTLFF